MPDMIDPQRRRELLGHTYDGRLVLNSEPAEFFDESKVVRGQPGNAGQFASRKGGSTKSADAADESSISGGGGELASQTRKRKNTTKKGLPGVDAGKARELIAQEATWLHDNAGSAEATPERIAAVAEKMKDLPKADLAKLAGSLGIKGLTSKTKSGLGEAIQQKISEKHKVANTVKETPEGKVITLGSGRKILEKKVAGGNHSEVEPEDGEDMTDDEWREYTDKLVKHGAAKAKGRHEASKKAYADSKKNGTSDKITSKPPVDAMAGHPFAGMDKKQMQAELERMDMMHNRDSNPWKIQPAGDPAVLNSIMDVVRQAKAKSSFARPRFGEVFDAVKAKHPDLTIKDFHQGLLKLQLDKKVRLDPHTQSKDSIDRPAEALPLDREVKNFLDVGNDGLQAMTNYPVNGEKPSPGKPVATVPRPLSAMVQREAQSMTDSAVSLDRRLNAAGSLDVEVLDRLINDGTAKTVGITHNEYLRRVEASYQEYERQKSWLGNDPVSIESARSELLKSLDRQEKRIRGELIPGLRKLAADGNTSNDFAAAADLYENQGMRLIAELRQKVMSDVANKKETDRITTKPPASEPEKPKKSSEPEKPKKSWLGRILGR